MLSQKTEIGVSVCGEERWLFLWLSFGQGSGIAVETDLPACRERELAARAMQVAVLVPWLGPLLGSAARG